MIVNYLISVLFLFISFLLFKKNDKELNIIHSIIYTIGLLFCYNTVIVFIFSFIKNIFGYSIINYIIGILLNIISYKRKKIQKYIFNKKEFLLFLLVIISSFIIVWIRFRGFNTIIYSSDDSSIHYRAALLFSDKLRILRDYDDVVYNFGKMMPANYINAGLFIKVFSNISSYKAYIIYDSMCYILYAILFLSIFVKLFKSKNYIYYYIICMLYILSFPFNNLLFGFGYLGLSIMVIQLLYYTIFSINNYNKNIIFNSIIIFILSFTLFFSYYLFMPFVYLSMFIYYIFLYKKNKIDFKIMFSYIIITLIIPFIIGFTYFLLPTIFTSKSVIKAISYWGLIYENLTPVYLFIFFLSYLVYFTKKKKYKVNYYFIQFYCLTIYIVLFLILYIFNISESYYFYKLYYVYIYMVIIFFMKYIIKKKSIIYIIFIFIMLSMIFVYNYPDNRLSLILDKISIYSYNSIRNVDDKIILDDKEIKITDKAREIKNSCEYDHVFYMVGNRDKNLWFYSIVGSYPTDEYKDSDKRRINENNNSFRDWIYKDKYNCVVYFYGNDDLVVDKNRYDIVYQNDKGAIIKRK